MFWGSQPLMMYSHRDERDHEGEGDGNKYPAWELQHTVEKYNGQRRQRKKE